MSMTDDGRVIVGEFPKNNDEVVRVALTEYKGIPLLDIRAWYGDGQKPGKGISIRRDQLPELRALILAAEAADADEKAARAAPGAKDRQDAH